MNIQFLRNTEGAVVANVNGHTFSSSDYIEIVKLLHSGEKVTAEFSAAITTEEKESLNKMIDSINGVVLMADQPLAETSVATTYPEEEINPEDIPF
jgi:hypothetical protein